MAKREAPDAGQPASNGDLPVANGGIEPTSRGEDMRAVAEHLRAAVTALETMDQAAPAAGRAVALAELRAAIADQDRFQRGLAHDLRNPLAAIRGEAQLLRRRRRRTGGAGFDAARFDAGLRNIDEAVERALALIDQVLEPAPPDAGDGDEAPAG